MSLKEVEGSANGPARKGRQCMSNEFLTASMDAAGQLQVAQRRHEALRAKADRRLAVAQQRHVADLHTAAAVEAAGWQVLMAVPGMTIATAARIGGTSESTVSRWLARGKGATCN